MLNTGTLHNDANASWDIESVPSSLWTFTIEARTATKPHPKIWNRLHQPWPRTALLASVTRIAKANPR